MLNPPAPPFMIPGPLFGEKARGQRQVLSKGQVLSKEGRRRKGLRGCCPRQRRRSSG